MVGALEDFGSKTHDRTVHWYFPTEFEFNQSRSTDAVVNVRISVDGGAGGGGKSPKVFAKGVCFVSFWCTTYFPINTPTNPTNKINLCSSLRVMLKVGTKDQWGRALQSISLMAWDECLI